MRQGNDSDNIFTHRILNSLLAGYSGELAYWKVLEQLGSPEVMNEAVKRIDETHDRIAGWYNGIARGDCLFSANWITPQTFEAKRAMTLLDSLATLVRQGSASIWTTLSKDWLRSRDLTRKMAANIARQAYSAKNYAEGVMDLSRMQGLAADANDENLLDLAKKEADRAAAIVVILGKHQLLPADLEKEFTRDARRSAFNLAAQEHDIHQLLATYNGGYDYLTRQWSPGELQPWADAGVNVIDAGYWRAYGFSADAAHSWLSSGVNIPGLAMAWREAGFAANDATEWVNAGVAPSLASVWRDAGHSTADASVYIKRGYSHPDMLPKGE